MISNTYALGIDLNNWHACHNLVLGGTLPSPEFLGLFSPGLVRQSVRSVSLDELITGKVEIGVISPRFASRVLAPIAINGALDKTGTIEIAFEETRRKIAPEAASRLC